MVDRRNTNLDLARLKIALLMAQYAQKMRVFIVENKAAGMTGSALRAMRLAPDSRWAMEREALNKTLKREVAGLVNRVHIQGWMPEGMGE